MKRLLALAAAALFSMFAGIEFILPKEDLFYFNPSAGVGDYFQVDVGDIDYTSLYGQVRGFNGGGAEMCDTAQRQDNRKTWVPIEEHSQWPSTILSSGLFDPVFVPDDESVTLIGLEDGIQYTLTAETNICAPYAGVINTSHYDCSFGKYMEYVITWPDGTVYTVTIHDAKCWYCCAKKSPPDDGKYTATTSDSLKGKTMRTGDILCIGQEGTTVTVQYGAQSQ